MRIEEKKSAVNARPGSFRRQQDYSRKKKKKPLTGLAGWVFVVGDGSRKWL